jgi:chromosome segregation ATPase
LFLVVVLEGCGSQKNEQKDSVGGAGDLPAEGDLDTTNENGKAEPGAPIKATTGHENLAELEMEAAEATKREREKLLEHQKAIREQAKLLEVEVVRKREQTTATQKAYDSAQDSRKQQEEALKKQTADAQAARTHADKAKLDREMAEQELPKLQDAAATAKKEYEAARVAEQSALRLSVDTTNAASGEIEKQTDDMAGNKLAVLSSRGSFLDESEGLSSVYRHHLVDDGSSDA